MLDEWEPKAPGGSSSWDSVLELQNNQGICHLHGAPILAVSTRQIVKEIVLKIQGSNDGFSNVKTCAHVLVGHN